LLEFFSMGCCGVWDAVWEKAQVVVASSSNVQIMRINDGNAWLLESHPMSRDGI